MKNPQTIAIIGAGAAGCMAAITAARTNPKAHVVLLDGNDQIGKKILATGNGRCNFTNELDSLDCYHTDAPETLRQALDAFGPQDVIDFFADLGIVAVSKNGYLYPMTNQAVSIRQALLLELQRNHVDVQLDARIIGVETISSEFRIRTKAWEMEVERCILCTGGKAAPGTGSDGSGYSFATRLGHQVIPPVPALVPLFCQKHPLREAAGVRVTAAVSTVDMDGKQLRDVGEVQITKQGISGIPVFQISGAVARRLANKLPAEVEIDFWPNKSAEEICAYVANRRACGYTAAEDIFNGVFAWPLITALFPQGIDGFSEENLVLAIKKVVVSISQTMGFSGAQTTSGGVSLQEVGTLTMESTLHPGLFFAGEVLHVDGICGGYNLQWAWTSGYLAGRSAAKELV